MKNSVRPATGSGRLRRRRPSSSTPRRRGTQSLLTELLSRIDLRPVDRATAELSVALGASYNLKAADSIHLATAVAAGADRFITNNRRDFDRQASETQATFPESLS